MKDRLIFFRSSPASCESTIRTTKWQFLLIILAPIVVGACSDVTDHVSDRASSHQNQQSRRQSLSLETVRTIENFCGDCHTLPRPDEFPKDNWEEEVIQGFDFYIASKRTDLTEPNRQDVIRYFVERAPETLVVPRADERVATALPISLKRLPAEYTSLDFPTSFSHVLPNPESGELFSADMRSGEIRRWRPSISKKWENEVIATGKHACRLTLCDFNADQITDLLVGEIGSFGVGDHYDGAVSLLMGQLDGSFERIVLAEGLSRVVEAQPIDYDGDGDLDILVADFGYLETGSLKLLRNVADHGSGFTATAFVVEIVDRRHGALGIRTADFDCDGHLDFVVAFGQEFESVEIFYNQGDGRYEKRIIQQLEGPSYNSSSIEVADINQDGLMDIVHTNGDTLDTFLAKPYHGVRWLENLGDRWQCHELGLLVGALQAAVSDLDSDGDQDIIAAGMFPVAHEFPSGTFDSICFWEQLAPGRFMQHSIERDELDYSSCALIDVDGDLRPDLIFAKWSGTPSSGSIVTFLNETARDDE